MTVECSNNYSFTPDYVSKGYKSYSGALKHFNKIVNKYKDRLTRGII